MSLPSLYHLTQNRRIRSSLGGNSLVLRHVSCFYGLLGTPLTELQDSTSRISVKKTKKPPNMVMTKPVNLSKLSTMRFSRTKSMSTMPMVIGRTMQQERTINFFLMVYLTTSTMTKETGLKRRRKLAKQQGISGIIETDWLKL